MTSIIKLGGSAISDKGVPFSFNEENVKELGRALAETGEQAFLIHGGGAWGHPVAAQYGLNAFSYSKNVIGASRTRRAMLMLSVKVQKALLDVGIGTFYMSPQHIVDGARVAGDLFSMGIYPLTYGDVIFEPGKGMRVIGGDEIALKLSGLIKAERAIFIINTEGIIGEDGETIRRISISGANGFSVKEIPIFVGGRTVKFGEVLQAIEKSSSDATGGIAYKLMVASKLASEGIVAYFVPPRSQEIAKAIKGEDIKGSVVIG